MSLFLLSVACIDPKVAVSDPDGADKIFDCYIFCRSGNTSFTIGFNLRSSLPIGSIECEGEIGLLPCPEKYT